MSVIITPIIIQTFLFFIGFLQEDLSLIGPITGAFCLLFFFIVFYRWSKRRKHWSSEAFRHILEELGFSYQGDDSKFSSQIGSLKFDLLKQSGKLGIHGIYILKKADVEVRVFEYISFEGRNFSMFKYQTVVSFTWVDIDLPQFIVKPKNISDSLSESLGLSGIRFENFPVFSKNYIIQGYDEDMIRNLISDPVIAFLENHPGWIIEANENSMIIHKPGHRIKAELLREYIEQIFPLLSYLRCSIYEEEEI